MSDPVEEAGDPMAQCRACLCKLKKNLMSQDIFKKYSFQIGWMEANRTTIAAEMAKVANIEIADLKGYPRHVCHKCLNRLKSAIPLIKDIRTSQETLRANLCNVEDDSSSKIWPKPIQLDRSLSENVLRDSTGVAIKQEVISDDECRDDDIEMEDDGQDNLSEMDIKLEPEEMIEQPEIQVTVNGTISEDLHDRISTMTNGFDVFDNEEYLESNSDPVIKQEPLSEDESTADLPMNCMLCTKQFHTLSGLRAHVIAQHSYKTVKRKADGSFSEQQQGSSAGKPVVKYVCNICKRNFSTSTDLQVHEVCHDKFACFACDAKFDTFKAVTQHRRWCKAKDAVARPPKTLTDILNERKAQMKAAAALYEDDQHWECWDCMLSFRNIFNYKVHNKKHHPTALDSTTTSEDKPKKMLDIEINIKQELKDDKTIKVKEEKAEVDYKKIETELESMFENENPCESDRSCNVTVDIVNVSEQLPESVFNKSDQDSTENELSSVTANKDNDNDPLKIAEAFKEDSEKKNELETAFNDSNSDLKETAVDNDSDMKTNNDDVVQQLSQENNTQNNEVTQASETKPVENNTMETDASDNNAHNNDLFKELSQENNTQNKPVTQASETKQTEDETMETDASENNKDIDGVLKEISQENNSQNNEEVARAQVSETKQVQDEPMETDTSDKNNKDTEAFDKNNKDTEASDLLSDFLKDTDSTENNNKDVNTELDIIDNCESAAGNIGDTKLNEKTELVE